jgi:DNA-binding SARP family transcriptional activator
MEELWPSQSPSGATNSLHQTLHFVRRDIAPWRDGAAAPEYIPLDAELVYLDPELVQVDSVSFMRQASDALGYADVSRKGPAILRLYLGRFAPEFEYEDWAADWRTLLHAQFLHLSHATAASFLVTNRLQPAIEILTNAVEIDGLAFEIRATLIRTLTRAGALDAAADHYRHYANLTKRELGVRAPPLDALLSEAD